MTNPNNYCVIMAGGIGTRFWPMSRVTRPKQFIDILGIGKTLMQLTWDRFIKVCPPENIFVVTNVLYKELVYEQLPNIPKNNILLEPVKRNTAPCIAYACFKIMDKNPDALIVVTPSDHEITNSDLFAQTVLNGMQFANQNQDTIVTLGIKPTRPETGYGYIQVLQEIAGKQDFAKLFSVKTFTEKPDLSLAQIFLDSGDFYWNSGIFIWSGKTIINAFKMFMLELHNTFAKGKGIYGTAEEEGFIAHIYPLCESKSIDYGVMEHATNVFVLCSDFGWSDLGTWGSLYQSMQQNETSDANNNVLKLNSEHTIVKIPEGKIAVVKGLNHYIVAESDGILLIYPMSDEQQMSDVISEVKQKFGEKYS